MAVDKTSVFASGVELGEDLRKRPAAAFQQSPPTRSARALDEKPKTSQSTQPNSKDLNLAHLFWQWEPVVVPLVLTGLALFTRLWKIGLSDIVTWDEAHFGKFGSQYIRREYYFDVHPPLGKMLVGLSGVLAGYNGSFDFSSGQKYPEHVDFTFMRAFNAIFGVLCIPLAYFTARALHFRLPAVWLVTLMVLCENSFTTISRFILLDSMLLFGTVATVFCWSKFHNQQRNSFEPWWFFWLFMTGLSAGCVCSVKLVGLFVTAMVGLYTAEDLWHKFGDTKMPLTTLAAHVAARVVGLIVVPSLIYMLCFAVHFAILSNSGSGDAQMSSLFQANLNGSNVGRDSPLEVAIGSRITLKNMGYGGGLLHSHVQTYPKGSKQQQVTCYHHKDSNNEWYVYPNRDLGDYDADSEDINFIGDGSVIRLLHAQTGRNLHSHDIAAPLSHSHKEVSGYGNSTVGDNKDHWKVEIIRDAASRNRSRVRTLTTAFRLKHPVLGCYLRATNKNLPEWGFRQIEVTCSKSSGRDSYSHWNVESHWNDKLPAGNSSIYKSPFLQDFFHLNVAMMASNNAMVPDPDKVDDLASKWWQWPILHVGLRMCGWSENITKYFLLGNPIVYWGSTAALGALSLTVAWYLLRYQRGYRDLGAEDLERLHYSGVYPAIGWFLHFLPFAIMARVTYVHHYYPALYFGILSFGFLVDWLMGKRGAKVQGVVYGILYSAVVGLYIFFLPICWGMTGENEKYRYLMWFDNWKISDKQK